MILSKIVTEVHGKLDQIGSTGYYTTPETVAAINEGQDLFALLTLCLETTASFTLQPSTTTYHMLATFPDWICPLRVYLPSGAHIKPARMEELDALDSSWLGSPGTPKRYAALGFDLFAIWQQPTVTTPINITYAKAPAALTFDADVPDIQEQFHSVLADYAAYRLRMREGAQEFAKALPYFGRFMEQTQKQAQFVRARNLAGRYDKVPFEISKADMSRMLKFRKDVMPRREKEDGE